MLSDSTSTAEEARHYARMTFGYGIGERSTTVLQVVPEVGIGITDRWGVQLRVPYVSIEGGLGSNSGAGDPMLTTSYAFIKEDHKGLDAMIGVKMNSGNANDIWKGDPTAQTTRTLPMPYQTSLGTTDLLLGVNYRHDRWSGALALQLPVKQANENTFTHAAWGQDPAALGYFESAALERAADAVARVQYRIPWRRFAVQPGLLAIQHLDTDTRLETAPTMDMMMPQRVEAQGSDGLTLNLTLDAGYHLNDRWTIELAYGSPLLVREERPDGLTRSMVLNTGLRYAF
jgi:hypothetical protein